MARRHPVAFGAVIGIVGYWAVQHFSGLLTSGKGAQASPGGGKPPSGG